MPTLTKRKATFAIIICFTAITTILGLTRDWAQIRMRHMNRYVVSELGFFGYALYDVTQTMLDILSGSNLLEEDLDSYRSFLEKRNPKSKEEGKRHPFLKNIIYIQFESLDGICAESSFRGEPILPVFDKLASEGIYFRNASDNTLGGRTTDGELLVTTSLLPLRRHPVFTKLDLSRAPSLPRILNEHGYHCLSMHGFEGTFWNRENAHRSLGYNDSLFIEELDSSEMTGWGISDESILRQANELIEALPEPFFLHIILLTNHHPYDHLRKQLKRGEQSIVEDYIDSIRYVDQSVGSFFETFSKSPIAERSIIAMYGDHDSGITDKVAKEISSPSDAIISDSIPILILGTDHAPARLTKVAGLQDIPVIILEDIGIELPITFIGNSVESDLTNLHPSFGDQFINKSFELIQSPAPVDLDKLTRLSILHPETLKGGDE